MWWRNTLKEAIDETPTEATLQLMSKQAGLWSTCYVGELRQSDDKRSTITTLHASNAPTDASLNELGCEFCLMIDQENYIEALDIADHIDIRVEQLAKGGS